jgi:hypothetical protein
MKLSMLKQPGDPGKKEIAARQRAIFAIRIESLLGPLKGLPRFASGVAPHARHDHARAQGRPSDGLRKSDVIGISRHGLGKDLILRYLS